MLRGVKGTDQVEENCRSLHPIIPFSNSFFRFPIILWIFTHYSHYSPCTQDWCQKGRLSWCWPYVFYRIYTGQKELGNKDDRAEKADWWQSHTQLTRSSQHHWMWTSMMPSLWSVAIAKSYTTTVYRPYGDHVTWFLVPLFSQNSSAYYSQRNSWMMCASLLSIHIVRFGALVQSSGVWAHSQSQLHTTVNYTSVQHLAEPDTPGGSETLSSI